MKSIQGLQTSIHYPIKHQTHILIHPSQQSLNKFSTLGHQKDSSNQIKNRNNKKGFAPYEISDSNFYIQSFYQDQQSNGKNQSNYKLLELRKRKNKRQKIRQIIKSHVDDGRGGNCVASNICKTLLRIILTLLVNFGKIQFNNLCKVYEIRSQKENTIILILILHVLAKKGVLSMQTYEQIMRQFLGSLKQSQSNCERKMSQQHQRRAFHQKNKRMYSRFAEIDKQLYDRSVKNLTQNEKFQLKQLQEIISQTYDRKQRQVQKAMGKIKSIILKHEELKEFFDYREIDVQEAFFESIDYAYRRNLPKRCRQVKQRARLIIERFTREKILIQAKDKYMMCYMTLKLIDEKEKEIWQEFLTNLTMKKQFNESEEQMEKFKNFLEKQIPFDFDNFTKNKAQKINIQKREKQSPQHELKIDEQTNYKTNQDALFTIYEELKETFQF